MTWRQILKDWFVKYCIPSKGPCTFCGVHTIHKHEEGTFAHPQCELQDCIKQDKERRRREKIDVIKVAIRELQEEEAAEERKHEK